MLTRHELETALDAKRLYMRMPTGNWWVVRRNGKTQTWKTRDGAFRIPFKAGLRATGALTESDLGETALRIAHDIPAGVNTFRVLIPHDVEVADKGKLTYRDQEIWLDEAGKTHQGIYIGPFVLWLANQAVEVGTLDAARKRIDEEEFRVAAVLQGEDGSLTIHTGKRR